MPQMQGNTLMSMFSPGSDIRGPNTPIMDPFAGRQHTRFEVPDSSKVVNLGEIVMFTMQSNNENFMTREILPIVPWGWAVRTFQWSIWNFNQFPVRPTPETAPPRFLSSSKLSETSTLIRFSIGHHMSNEYGKTEMGKANQTYNLQQIELSVQECLNNLATRALHDAQYQHRARMEKFGKYRSTDVEKAMTEEVTQFAMPIKQEHGFQLLFEAINTRMQETGGNVTAAILTNRINTLVLTKPEMIEYYRAGPSGPALVSSPNRSFLPSGIKIYWQKTYPERFGLENGGLWQKLVQIGNYHKSMELPALRSSTLAYLEGYSTYMRNITIYDQETNALHTITAEEMMDNSCMFDNDGNLRSADNPPNSRPGRRNMHADPSGKGDFLSFEKENPMHDKQSIEDVFGHDTRGGIVHRGSFSKPQGHDQLPPSLEVFGQLRECDFKAADVKETGIQIMCRLAKLSRSGSSASFSSKIMAGLQLYESMCKRDVDLVFLNLALKNHIKNLYQRIYPSLTHSPVNGANGRNQVSPELLSLWKDVEAPTRAKVYQRITSSAIKENQATGEITLLNGNNLSSYIPLPMGSEVEFPEAKGRIFGNLTGYASYNGFQAMGDAYRSGNTVVSSRYNIEELKVAAEFVEALEHTANAVCSILPDCQCFKNQAKSRGELLAEQLINMVGFPLWANIKKTELFLVDSTTYTSLSTKDITTNKGGKLIASMVDVEVVDKVTRHEMGELYEEFTRSGLGHYYASQKEGQENVLQIFERVMSKALKLVNEVEFSKALGEVQGTAILANTNNHDIKTRNELWKILKAWIEPGTNAPVGYGVDINAAKLEVTNKTASCNSVWIDPNETVTTAIAKANKINRLAFSDPNTAFTFLPLFGPARLQLYSAVLEAATLAGLIYRGAKNLTKLLTAILTLNLLMLPSVDNVLIAGRTDTPAAYFLHTANAGTTYVGKEYAAFGTYYQGIATAIALRNAHFTETDLSKIFLKILDDIFQPTYITTQVKEQVDHLKHRVNNAMKDQSEFDAVLQVTITAGSTKLKLPFLQDLTSKANVPHSITYEHNATLLKNAMIELLGDSKNGTLPHYLGLRRREMEVDFSAASTATIGGRQLPPSFPMYGWDQELGSQYRPQRQNNDGLDFDISAQGFVKTSLVVVSEQLVYLFEKNSPNLSKNIYDIRVGTPTDPGKYVNWEAQHDMESRMTDVQKTFRRLTQQYLSHNGWGKSLPLEWVDVPYLTSHDRLRCTFFGPPTDDGDLGSHRIAGIRMNARLTNSFVRKCQYLDATCQSEPFEKYMALLWMCTSFTKESYLALLTHNVRIPNNWLVVRPHMNYLMETCALVDPGIDNLGFTAVAGNDYSWGSTALTKEFNAHLSFWANCIITSPQNCRIVKNLMSVGYGPGGGCGWFTPATYNVKNLADHRKPASPGSKSLICIPIPFTEDVTREYISTGGHLQHVDPDGRGASDVVLSLESDSKPHYSTHVRANNIWGWKHAPGASFMATTGTNGQFGVYNTICWSGMTFYSNIPTNTNPSGQLTHMTLNKGHWGPNQGPGCQAIYQGQVAALPNFEYEKRFTIVP